MYQNLYRKYRPSDFDNVVGQSIIIQTLKNEIKNNKLSHAYLFTGPRGTGKTSIAKILAKTINCENLKDYLPCNQCVNCTQYINKQSMDIIEIDAASNNGVEEIRELKSKISLVPAIGKYKVYIIDEVHMLSTGAFNALLKTLEEPPKHIIFILATTEPHKIPATILSRCQRFDFKKIHISEILKRLNYVVGEEKINIDDTALTEIALLADGGMRDALSLLDQTVSYCSNKITLEDVHEINGTLNSNEYEQFIGYLVDNDTEQLFKKIELYDQKGKNFVKITEELITIFRNFLIKTTAPKFYEETIDYKLNDELLNKLSLNKILEYINSLNDCLYNMKKNSNFKLLFEISIIQLLNTDIKIKKTLEENNKYDLKEIRINNTLCSFNKKQLLDFKIKLDQIYKVKDKKYDKVLELLKQAELKAVGNNNLIFVFKDDKDSEKFNKNLKLIEKLLNEVYNDEYKVISTNQDSWNIIKEEFNNHSKEYKYINE